MNCNKCGTPILPGESSCRFCGTVGDYSKRNHEEAKPEIIDFTTGDDDVVIIDDEPVEIESNSVIEPISVPVAPIFNMPEFIPTPVVVPITEVEEIPKSDFANLNVAMTDTNPVVPEIETTFSIPMVTPIISEPFSAVMPASEPVETIVPNIELEPVTPVIVEDVLTSVIDPIIEPTVSFASNSVPTAVSASTPIIVTKIESKESKEELLKEMVPPINDEKNSSKEKKTGHGLFNIVTFILLILLVMSVIANYLLFMENSEEKEEATTTPVVSTTNQTAYFSGYKVEVPSNWVAVTNKDVSYITLMDSTEDWAFTLNVSPNTNASDITNKTSVANITKAFGINKYLFTSDYSKTINGKDFYIFKGKYYDYSVYIITSSLDSTNAVVADLKFKGEVDETVLTSVLNSLATVSIKDLTSFYTNDFSFSDISSLITENTSTETTANVEGNE